MSQNDYFDPSPDVLLRRVVQSAFRVSTAARLPLGKEGQTYRRWIEWADLLGCGLCSSKSIQKNK
eukprot:scaffold29690_cov59-Attheya_sp.AAC.13